MVQSASSSLAAQEEKREKIHPPLLKYQNHGTIFFGAAIPPSPSSVKDKLHSFAISTQVFLCKDAWVKNKPALCSLVVVGNSVMENLMVTFVVDVVVVGHHQVAVHVIVRHRRCFKWPERLLYLTFGAKAVLTHPGKLRNLGDKAGEK